MRLTRTKSLFACLCCFAFASTAVADDAENASLSTTEKERPTYLNRSFDELATLPSFSMGAPAGLVPSFGVVFAGIGGMTKSPGSGDTDGSMAIGMGYGNAHESYGGAVTLGIGSINNDSDFASTGVLSVSLGRFFTEQLTGVSVGVINIDTWHDSRSMPKPSVYVAATRIISNDALNMVASAGIGTNGYTFLRSTETDRTSKLGVFGSVGAYVFPRLSVILDYTSGVTSTGVSIVPIASQSLTFNVGVYDVFKYIPNNDDTTIMASIAYAYAF